MCCDHQKAPIHSDVVAASDVTPAARRHGERRELVLIVINSVTRK